MKSFLISLITTFLILYLNNELGFNAMRIIVGIFISVFLITILALYGVFKLIDKRQAHDKN